VIAILLNEGAQVSAYDPAFPKDVPANVASAMVGSALEAANGSNALVVLTDWQEFCDVPMDRIADVMRGQLVIDGRNILKPDVVAAAGLIYMGMGRPTRNPIMEVIA
jgi:UDPglucose 6-dehydrogenase